MCREVPPQELDGFSDDLARTRVGSLVVEAVLPVRVVVENERDVAAQSLRDETIETRQRSGVWSFPARATKMGGTLPVLSESATAGENCRT